MRRLSTGRLAEAVKARREEKGLTQEDLSRLTGINRVMIGRIERESFIPSIQQFEALADALGFDVTEMFVDREEDRSFIALRSGALSDGEKKGLEDLLAMMLALRQQILLRRKLGSEPRNGI